MKTDAELVATKLLGWDNKPNDLLGWDKDGRWRTAERFNGLPIVRTLDWLTTGDGMVAILEALREKGVYLKIDTTFDGHQWYVGQSLVSWDEKYGSPAVADTLPEAVLAAAASALRAEDG